MNRRGDVNADIQGTVRRPHRRNAAGDSAPVFDFIASGTIDISRDLAGRASRRTTLSLILVSAEELAHSKLDEGEDGDTLDDGPEVELLDVRYLSCSDHDNQSKYSRHPPPPVAAASVPTSLLLCVLMDR